MHIGLIGGIGPAATEFYYRGLCDAFEPISPLPVLNGVTALNAHLNRSGLTRVGLLGTRFVTETGVYGKVTGIDLVYPSDADIATVHEAYVGMATAGRVTDAQRYILLGAGRKMMESQGADAIVLASTDLYLALEAHDSGYPTIDAAAVHVAAIFEAASAGSG